MTISFSIKNLLLILFTTIILYIAYHSRQVIMISIFGFLIAYMTSPLAYKLTSFKIPYPLAAMIVIAGILGILVFISLWVVPKIYHDAEKMAAELPGYISVAMVKVSEIGAYFDIDLSSAALYNKAMLKITESGNSILKGLGNVLGSVQYAFALTMNIVLIPVIAFFVLIDYPGIARFMDKYLGIDKNKGIRKYLTLSSEVMASYFRGQFTVMAILCVLYSIALKIAGIDAAILLGTMTGLLTIVPYLGFSVGIILSLLFSLIQYQDFLHPLYVIIGYTVVQLLESFIITPKIVGDSVGLHPVATIILLLMGGAAFGLIGMIFALPVAAMFFRGYKEHLTDKAVTAENVDTRG